jgi:hypothetical protein
MRGAKREFHCKLIDLFGSALYVLIVRQGRFVRLRTLLCGGEQVACAMFVDEMRASLRTCSPGRAIGMTDERLQMLTSDSSKPAHREDAAMNGAQLRRCISPELKPDTHFMMLLARLKPCPYYKASAD